MFRKLKYRELKIAEKIPTPGPGLRKEGEFSGEYFREEILFPELKKSIEEKRKLLVDLDRTSGYGVSFLKEAFGGLILKNNIEYKTIKHYLKLKSEEEKYLIDEIYIVLLSNEELRKNG